MSIIINFSLILLCFSEFTLSKMESGNLQLTLAAMLDFETSSNYELIIEASDRGEPSRSSRLAVVVSVIDEIVGEIYFIKYKDYVYVM